MFSNCNLCWCRFTLRTKDRRVVLVTSQVDRGLAWRPSLTSVPTHIKTPTTWTTAAQRSVSWWMLWKIVKKMLTLICVVFDCIQWSWKFMLLLINITVIIIIIDHPRSGAAYNFGRVCLYVCLSDDNFQKPWCSKFVFAHPLYLQGIRLSSYMKIKVTGAEKYKICIPTL